MSLTWYDHVKGPRDIATYRAVSGFHFDGDGPLCWEIRPLRRHGRIAWTIDGSRELVDLYGRQEFSTVEDAMRFCDYMEPLLEDALT